MRILLDGTQVGGSKYTTPPVVSISTSPSGLSTANATAGVRKITASTSAPSGGADGDVWIKYTA